MQGTTGIEQVRILRDDAIAVPGRHFLLGWTAAWLAVGVAVAAGISFGAGVEFVPVLRLSVLFAEVVGYSAYTSARLVSPLLARLPGGLRLALDELFVLAGAGFGSLAVLLTDPLFLLAEFRTVLLLLALNALLAAGVAAALGTYDRMRRQIEASYRVLRERDALEREMTVARDVQRELLPREAAPPFRGTGAGRGLPAGDRRGRRLLRLPAARRRPSRGSSSRTSRARAFLPPSSWRACRPRCAVCSPPARRPPGQLHETAERRAAMPLLVRRRVTQRPSSPTSIRSPAG